MVGILVNILKSERDRLSMIVHLFINLPTLETIGCDKMDNRSSKIIKKTDDIKKNVSRLVGKVSKNNWDEPSGVFLEELRRLSDEDIQRLTFAERKCQIYLVAFIAIISILVSLILDESFRILFNNNIWYAKLLFALFVISVCIGLLGSYFSLKGLSIQKYHKFYGHELANLMSYPNGKVKLANNIWGCPR